jgi:hypothetical protein
VKPKYTLTRQAITNAGASANQCDTRRPCQQRYRHLNHPTSRLNQRDCVKGTRSYLRDGASMRLTKADSINVLALRSRPGVDISRSTLTCRVGAARIASCSLTMHLAVLVPGNDRR